MRTREECCDTGEDNNIIYTNDICETAFKISQASWALKEKSKEIKQWQKLRDIEKKVKNEITRDNTTKQKQKYPTALTLLQRVRRQNL